MRHHQQAPGLDGTKSSVTSDKMPNEDLMMKTRSSTAPKGEQNQTWDNTSLDH